MMLARALQKKGLCFNAIACEPAEWEVLQKMDSSLFEGSTRNYGIHPMAIADVTEADWERLESLLDNYPDANVGECGLDKRYDGYAEGGLQEQAFRRQVELARNLHRDLHIHCVGDYGRIIKILEECGYPGKKSNIKSRQRAPKVHVTFHRFGGDISIVKQRRNSIRYSRCTSIPSIRNRPLPPFRRFLQNKSVSKLMQTKPSARQTFSRTNLSIKLRKP